MFELSIAFKYLRPRRRQLSVSIIALLSIAVIALVVWLVLVFLSVTRGIEQRWVKTLIALNAPLRLSPTDAYYNSYYYLVDEYSESAGYSLKTIGDKLNASLCDPYDPLVDEELPQGLPAPDRASDGSLKDPVKGAYEAIAALKFGEVRAQEFEMALANLRLRLIREGDQTVNGEPNYTQSFLSQVSYISSFDAENQELLATLVPPSAADIAHQLQLLSLSSDNIREEAPSVDRALSPALFQERARRFFEHAKIAKLKTREGGWICPRELLPKQGGMQAELFEDEGGGSHLTLFKERVKERVGLSGQIVEVIFDNEGLHCFGGSKEPITLGTGCQIAIDGGVELLASLIPSSIGSAKEPGGVLFETTFELQGIKLAGAASLQGLSVTEASAERHFSETPALAPPWVHSIKEVGAVLPQDAALGEGILLATSFREKGVLVGDRGYLAFYAATPSALQEQRIPIYIAGFYDPGMMPTGSRLILASREITRDMRAAVNQVDQTKGNGINVWIKEIDRVDEAKAELAAALEAKGLAPYWQIETYREYEFAKPLVEQFQSDRHLFTIIALIVIVVACSNIISMLIVLVNDKRREIGILQSMGASSKSIAAIFAICGASMGILGSAIGLATAYATLANLQRLVHLLSRLQGHEIFNKAFFGGTLPSTLDSHVLRFVIIATILLSLLAGLVPAIKASLMRPAAILRSE